MTPARSKALEALAKKLKLTRQQRALCEYVVAHPQAQGPELSRAAGYRGKSDGGRRVWVSNSLKKPACVKYIAAVRAALNIQSLEQKTEETLVAAERTLLEIARLAFSDIRQMFDADGNLLPVTKWPAVVSAAVASVEVVKRNVYVGDGKIDDVIKIRLWDKPKNLEMLAKHLQLLVERVEHTGDVSFRWMGDDEAP